MTLLLTSIEARVLGSLIEKEVTTPEYYPLSLNALANACNQKSNRDPVTNLDEDEIRQALHGLEDKKLAGRAHGSDGRVTKYEHWMQEAFNFSRGEVAVLCALLLRGPQTPGELRSRTERLHSFAEISDVQSALQRLMQREPSLVRVLSRQPGTKEARYAHLLSGEAGPEASYNRPPPAANPSLESDRIAQAEEQIAALRLEISEMKQQIAKLLTLLGS